MRAYLATLRHVLAAGTPARNRTGVDTLSVFGYQARYDLRDGFPLLTTKRVPFKSVLGELLWFLSGSTNVRDLQARGVTIWDEWADPATGDLGPVYGHQWRNFGGVRAKEPAPAPDQAGRWGAGVVKLAHPTQWTQGQVDAARAITDAPLTAPTDGRTEYLGPSGVDQIANLVRDIRATVADPTASVGRRLVLTAWNPAEVAAAKLPACHCFVQWSVRPATVPCPPHFGECAAARAAWERDVRRPPALSCHLYQRSADVFLGVPFNVASYALLTHMLAQVTGCVPGELVHSFGDLHLYVNHMAQAQEQLAREPRALPALLLDAAVREIDDFVDTAADTSFVLVGYDPHPAIRAPVAV